MEQTVQKSITGTLKEMLELTHHLFTEGVIDTTFTIQSQEEGIQLDFNQIKALWIDLGMITVN